MNKKMRELQDKIQQKHAAAQSFMSEGENKDLTKAENLLNEVDELQKEFDLEARLFKAGKATAEGAQEGIPGASGEPKKVDSIKAFADAVRKGFPVSKDLNETTPADGGYTVPEDISTMINEFRQEHFSLASLIEHETVITKSGRRTYKQRSQNVGFSQVAEAGAIGKVTAPQFSVIEYNIKKYAGYMPVTNELLEDSDAAIAEMMARWLAGESVATENAQILAKINTVSATTITGIKDIKKAVNVDLAAFAGTVRVVTNADGLQYFDTLEDANKRPLLSPDPTKPMEPTLSVGTRKIPIVVIPNDVLPTTDNKIPIIIGDLREFLKQFDRKGVTLTTSSVAAVEGFNAFEQDMTLVRAIMRADWVTKDTAAIVRGELTVTA